jgi:O-antigen/teichoic acid export membrane protein
LSFLDLGFGQGIIKFVSHYEAKKDFIKINEIINTTLVINLIMGTIGFISIFILSEVLSEKIFKVSSNHLNLSVTAFKIVSIGFFLNILSSTFSNIPRALQRYDLTVKIQNIIWILSVTSSVVLLYFGYGLIQILSVYILFQVLGLILYFFAAQKILPFMNLSIKFKKDTFNEVFKFSVFTSINSITGNIVFRVDKMIISHFLGTSAVTYYQIPFLIVQMSNGFISSVIQFLFPAVSFLNSSGEKEKLKEIYKKSTRYVFALSLIIVSGLILLGKPFLNFWMGEQIAKISYPLMVIISIVFFFNSISMVGYYFYNGLGKANINMISSLIGSSCYLIVALFFIPAFNLNGAALSFAFILVPYPFYIYLLTKLIDTSLLKWYIISIAQSVALIAVCLLFLFFIRQYGTYLRIFLSALFLIFETIFVFLIRLLNYNDLYQVKKRMLI